MRVASKHVADRAIANFFYANGLPFGNANCEVDSCYKQMVQAIIEAGPSYVPPSAHAIGGRLIADCHGQLLCSLKARDPIGSNAARFCETYVSDGWEDVHRCPLVNSAYITANDGGTYLRSVDTTGKTKDAKYLAALMIEDIYAIGATNVIAVCTDTCNSNASFMEAC